MSLPQLAISADGSTFAIGCTHSEVTLYAGQILSSKQGQVTVFRWNPNKRKCQVVGNLYGTSKNEAFGRSLALNGHGYIIAVAGQEPSHLYVYQYTNKQWKQRGQTLEENNHKVLISNDGDILPAIKLKSKAVKVYHYNASGDIWQEEPFDTNAIVGRSSSLALSGNGQVLAVQRADGRRGIGVALLHRVPWNDGNQSHIWEYNPFNGFISAGGRHSTFGMVTSLSYDGTRIAIAEPSHADGYGRVYVYDYKYDQKTKTFAWVSHGDPLVGSYIKDAFGRQLWLSQDGKTLVVKSISYSMIYEYDPPKCILVGSETMAS